MKGLTNCCGIENNVEIPIEVPNRSPEMYAAHPTPIDITTSQMDANFRNGF